MPRGRLRRMAAPLVSVHLDAPTLASVRAGGFNFLQRVRAAVEETGWRVAWRAEDEAPERHSLWHMRAPPGSGGLIFRRTYHYPFWHIEAVPERWLWPVARASFDPEAVPVEPARRFTARLAARVLPGPPPTRDGPALVPLQGRLRQHRSFQAMSPLDMVEAVGRSGRPARVTLHPRETYEAEDRRALDRVIAAHSALEMAEGSAALLRGCAFVATQNSAVAFDGLILGKAAVLFARADFHHIALKVADLGAATALARAPRHRPPWPRYLMWFLGQAIDAMAPDAEAQVLAALRRGGWRI